MKRDSQRASNSSTPGQGSPGWWRLLGVGLLVVTVLTWFLVRRAGETARQDTAAASRKVASPGQPANVSSLKRHAADAPGVPPGDAVAARLSKFIARRRELVHGLAKRLNLAVPAKVDQYFDAAAAGRKDEALALFIQLWELVRSRQDPALSALWRPILEAHGVAEQVEKWPAQPLLDYGNLVLDSLAPGMAYLGGSDSGAFIPLLLNETGDGPQHLVFTQNALSDPGYMDYLSCLYGDQMKLLAAQDTDAIRQAYLGDYQARLAHDQAFPNEPRQVQPGEAIPIVNGQPDLSSSVANSALNERLLQRLMELNPGLAFGMEASLSFKSAYAQAMPLGPIMQLATGSANPITSDGANQVASFWQSATSQLLSDPATMDSMNARGSYTKLMVSQANLLASQNFAGPAEQTLRLAAQLTPDDPSTVLSYVQLLTQQNRNADALQVVGNALKLSPNNPTFQAVSRQLQTALPGQ